MNCAEKKNTIDYNQSMVDKKISVVIPIYNGEKYIVKAIQSVAEQTLLPYEIIVVNDGSTDDSTSIINNLAKIYPIKIFHKENGGQSSARNYGVRCSTGNLIAFIDQDDIWYPNHLEELIKPYLDSYYPEIGWVYSTMDEIGVNGELYRIDILSANDIVHPKKTIYQCLSMDMFVVPSATLVSKKAFLDVGGFDERLSGYEDDDLFLRIFFKGYGNIFIDKSLGQWRIYDKSCSWSTKMATSRIIYAKKLLEKFNNDYVRNCNYQRDFILPRFINIIMDEYKRGIRFKNKDHVKLMYDDIHTLYPYMNKKQRLYCNTMLLAYKYRIIKLMLYPFIKIYRIIKNN